VSSLALREVAAACDSLLRATAASRGSNCATLLPASPPDAHPPRVPRSRRKVRCPWQHRGVCRGRWWVPSPPIRLGWVRVAIRHWHWQWAAVRGAHPAHAVPDGQLPVGGRPKTRPRGVRSTVLLPGEGIPRLPCVPGWAHLAPRAVALLAGCPTSTSALVVMYRPSSSRGSGCLPLSRTPAALTAVCFVLEHHWRVQPTRPQAVHPWGALAGVASRRSFSVGKGPRFGRGSVFSDSAGSPGPQAGYDVLATSGTFASKRRAPGGAPFGTATRDCAAKLYA
jgi:hypothetical protein